MRLATTIALALCIALPSPIAANASDAVIPIHKHRTHMHLAVYRSFNPATIALAPPHAIVPVAPTVKSDDDYDGLSRDRDQCNRGCIDEGGG
jgi:hypothetical protein